MEHVAKNFAMNLAKKKLRKSAFLVYMWYPQNPILSSFYPLHTNFCPFLLILAHCGGDRQAIRLREKVLFL